MIPSSEEIDNMKILVRCSLGDQYIDKLLLNIIEYNYRCWKSEPSNQEYIKELLIALQTFGEFGLFWQASFEDILDDLPIDKAAFKSQINFRAMYLKPTHTNLRQIFQWYGCRQNSFPSKNELLKVIHEICCKKPSKEITYYFEEPKHHYMLSWVEPYWLLHDCQKSLTWYLRS